MNQEETKGLIRGTEFFKSFTEEELNEFTEGANVVQFPAGEHIVRQGDEDQSLFLILQGSAIITKNRDPKLEVGRLESGSVFGEMAYILQTPRASNVIVKSSYAILLQMDGKLFQNLKPATREKVHNRFLKVVAGRIENMNTQVGDLKRELTNVAASQKRLREELEEIRKNSR